MINGYTTGLHWDYSLPTTNLSRENKQDGKILPPCFNILKNILTAYKCLRANFINSSTESTLLPANILSNVLTT